MLNILRTSLRTGRVTVPYPKVSRVEPYRGRPEIAPSRCDCTGACARVCPSSAIVMGRESSGGRRWQMDLARCVFCGLCEEACPNGAIVMTNDFELATRSRDDLIVGVTHSRSAVSSAQRPSSAFDESDLRDNRCAPEDSVASFWSKTLVAPRPALWRTETSAATDGTSHQELANLGGRIRGLLRRSLHIRHMAAGSDNSCDWEIAHLLNPVYDVQRLGIDFVASPRHADLLLVTGAVTRNLEIALLATYEGMPSPRLVVAVGDEACGGGVLQGSYAVAGGVDRCLPVDVYIPGDPPRPQAIIQGLLIALGKLEPKLHRLEFLAGG